MSEKSGREIVTSKFIPGWARRPDADLWFEMPNVGGPPEEKEQAEGSLAIDLARFLQGSMRNSPKAHSREVFLAQLASEHCGDCTGEPQSCMRCFAERYLAQAETILKLASDEGLDLGRAE